MRFLFAFAVMVLLAAGFNLSAAAPASAQCAGPCGAVLVPPPNPIPLRSLRVVPGPPPLAAPCGAGCVNGVQANVAPPPCGQGGCGGVPLTYFPKRFYAYWKQPGYTACFPGPGNCYWRRDCWYDSFGRRFCN